ncbi:MAG: hypothetical protein ABI481_01500, partial [Pyrinomonadaceae bacterium]
MINRKVLSILIFSICVIAAASAVQAQGRYANVYSRADIDGFIRNLENSSDVFSRDFKNTGGTSTNERRTVDKFENAVDRLRNRFNGSNQNWWRNRAEVQGIMSEARQVNVMMNNDRYGRPLESQWRSLRQDINKLADTYELPELAGQYGGGGGGGGYPGGGGGSTRPPKWAVGTWYWVQGQNRSFSISSNGVVTENAGGYVNTGTYRNGSIFLNGNQSSVTRTANGIRTYNNSTGETSDYVHGNYPVGGGGGGGGYPGGDGNMSRPPNWAVGTWTWIQGYGRQFTIEATGRVVENIAGQVSYGTYYNGVIMLNGNSSTVTSYGSNTLTDN